MMNEYIVITDRFSLLSIIMGGAERKNKGQYKAFAFCT